MRSRMLRVGGEGGRNVHTYEFMGVTSPEAEETAYVSVDANVFDTFVGGLFAEVEGHFRQLSPGSHLHLTNIIFDFWFGPVRTNVVNTSRVVSFPLVFPVLLMLRAEHGGRDRALSILDHPPHWLPNVVEELEWPEALL